jgi:hypothetical protein
MMRGQDRRAISGPLTPVTSGLSRSLADTSQRRSGRTTARIAQIPKLIARVRFPSPDPRTKAQVRAGLERSIAGSSDAVDGVPCPLARGHQALCRPDLVALVVTLFALDASEMPPLPAQTPIPITHAAFHRCSCPATSAAAFCAAWPASNSRQLPASWVITAYRSPEPVSRQASNVGPARPGRCRTRTPGTRPGTGPVPPASKASARDSDWSSPSSSGVSVV